MADGDIWVSFAGIVQFDPQDKTTPNGTPLRNVTIRLVNDAERRQAYLTVWPRHKDTPIKKGDLLFGDAKLRKNQKEREDGTVVTYINLDAQTLFRFAPEAEAAREVANAQPAAQTTQSGATSRPDLF